MASTYSVNYDLTALDDIIQDYGQYTLTGSTESTESTASTASTASTGSTASIASTGSTASSRSSSRASLVNSNEKTYSSNSVKIHYISANKLFKYGKYDEKQKVDCSICLNDIKKNSMTVKMGCGHYFHKACLFNWVDISKNTFCPNCRYDEF